MTQLRSILYTQLYMDRFPPQPGPVEPTGPRFGSAMTSTLTTAECLLFLKYGACAD